MRHHAILSRDGKVTQIAVLDLSIRDHHKQNDSDSWHKNRGNEAADPTASCHFNFTFNAHGRPRLITVVKEAAQASMCGAELALAPVLITAIESAAHVLSFILAHLAELISNLHLAALLFGHIYQVDIV